MAKGLNKVLLIGNVGRDPVVNTTTSGQRVASFSLATTEEWNDQSGMRQSKTDWHNIVVWGNLAEIAGNYVRKGRQIYVEGRIQTRSYQDRNGQDRTVTEIVASDFILLSSGNMQGGYQAGADISGRAGGNTGYNDGGYQGTFSTSQGGGYQNNYGSQGGGYGGGMNGSAQRGYQGGSGFSGRNFSSQGGAEQPNASGFQQQNNYNSFRNQTAAGMPQDRSDGFASQGDTPVTSPNQNGGWQQNSAPLAPSSRGNPASASPLQSVQSPAVDNTISNAVARASSATSTSIDDDEDIPF